MKSRRQTQDSVVDRFLQGLGEPGPSQEDVERSGEQLLRVLEREWDRSPRVHARSLSYSAGRVWRWRWGSTLAIVSVFLLFVVMLHRVNRNVMATLSSGSLTVFISGSFQPIAVGSGIDSGLPLQTGPAGATLNLADGSRVEISAESSVSIVRAEDGQEIRLAGERLSRPRRSRKAVISTFEQEIAR